MQISSLLFLSVSVDEDQEDGPLGIAIPIAEEEKPPEVCNSYQIIFFVLCIAYCLHVSYNTHDILFKVCLSTICS